MGDKTIQPTNSVKPMLDFAIPASSKKDDIVELSKDGKCCVSEARAGSTADRKAETPDQIRACEAIDNFQGILNEQENRAQTLTVGRLQDLQQQVGRLEKAQSFDAVRDGGPGTQAGFQCLQEWGVEIEGMSKNQEASFAILFDAHAKASNAPVVPASAPRNTQEYRGLDAMKGLYLAAFEDEGLAAVLALHMTEYSAGLGETAHNLNHDSEAFPASFLRLGEADRHLRQEFESRQTDLGEDMLNKFVRFCNFNAMCDLRENNPEDLKRLTKAVVNKEFAGIEGADIPSSLQDEALVFATVYALEEVKAAATERNRDSQKKDQVRVQETAAAAVKAGAYIREALQSFHAYKKDPKGKSVGVHFEEDPSEDVQSLAAAKASEVRAAVDDALATIGRGGVRLESEHEMGKFVLEK